MMRAMRQTLAFCVLLLGVAGCGDDSNNAASTCRCRPISRGPPDMCALNGVELRLDDLRRRPELLRHRQRHRHHLGAPASPPAAACTGGATLTCDGPEDCSRLAVLLRHHHASPAASIPTPARRCSTAAPPRCTGTCDFNLEPGPADAGDDAPLPRRRRLHGLSAFGQQPRPLLLLGAWRPACTSARRHQLARHHAARSYALARYRAATALPTAASAATASPRCRATAPSRAAGCGWPCRR